VADPLDSLYEASLDDFVAVRKEVAAALKKAGDAERAAEVAKQRKPTVHVWAVNQAARRDRATAKALVEAAEQVAAVQAGRKRGDLRAEQERLRELSATLVGEAEHALADAGRPIPDTIGQRLHDLLRAVASDEAARSALAAGRLAEEPELGGFASLGALGDVKPAKAAAGASKADERRRQREEEREARAQELRAEIREAEARAAQARKAAERAERELVALQQSLERLERADGR
jgi:hypothetical protein